MCQQISLILNFFANAPGHFIRQQADYIEHVEEGNAWGTFTLGKIQHKQFLAFVFENMHDTHTPLKRPRVW